MTKQNLIVIRIIPENPGKVKWGIGWWHRGNVCILSLIRIFNILKKYIESAIPIHSNLFIYFCSYGIGAQNIYIVQWWNRRQCGSVNPQEPKYSKQIKGPSVKCMKKKYSKINHFLIRKSSLITRFSFLTRYTSKGPWCEVVLRSPKTIVPPRKEGSICFIFQLCSLNNSSRSSAKPFLSVIVPRKTW